MIRQTVFTLGSLVMLLSMACSTTPSSSPQENPELMLISTGQKLFDENCATCHGGSGHGNPMMMQGRAIHFDTASWQKLHTDDYIKQTIQQGKGMMPDFADTFNDEELDALVKYVRTLAKD